MTIASKLNLHKYSLHTFNNTLQKQFLESDNYLIERRFAVSNMLFSLTNSNISTSTPHFQTFLRDVIT
ncbi:hypothetical protein E2C01_077795 [Portunus trituberculatus]|uniref:Uncharacterized protein n=1 Tax=Portunus trituberculatus TaxID=210409 RepID=A0A5B7ISF0_PORTR|nr:hypothetical protein [Portunus trituberculatus]